MEGSFVFVLCPSQKSAVDLGLGLSTKKYFLPYCKNYRILNLIFPYCKEIPYSKNMTQYYVGTIR